MAGSRRPYVFAFSCAVAVTALLFVGARATATATVHRTEARCGRPATVTTAARPAAAVPRTGPAPRSWRAHTLRVAGCGAWRQVHDRMRQRH
jgi:hypothetical protein